MAVTSAIIAAVSTTASLVAANQRSQDAKGEAGKLLASRPNPLVTAANDVRLGQNAANRQKQLAAGANGFSSTILTGPSDMGNTAAGPGPVTKGRGTLLGS